jgi:hypothetical protein
LSRYNDQAFKIVNTNSFAGLQVSNTMSAWLLDPEKMQKETGLSYSDVFQKLPAHIDSIRVQPEVVQTQEVISPDSVVQWQCLRAPSAIEKDVPLLEVNGQIGFQALYCAEPENRWAELTAPLPFVLFHPLLPLYIDTRREGSEARFVRRSCRPNAVLETYLSAGSEYHFWLVSDRQIAAREQITIPWDFRFPTTEKARALRTLGLSDDTSDESSVDENDYQKYAGWVHLILSEHGGCACNLGPECAFARFRRNYLAKTQPRANPPKPKKRKPKTQHAISPTSTGHATNSRAPSEGHLEDEQHRRSLSSSSRSKPPSRDMTPTARQGSFDTLGILTEPTDRDKRKVAMVEDTFRRLEQQQHQPPRKRKRASDGTGTSHAKASKTGSATQTSTLPSGFHEREYMDVGTGPSMSSPGSPSDVGPAYTMAPRKNPGSRNTSVSARSRPVSATPHRNYCDAAVQTDLPQPDAKTPLRRVGSCLRKRLLESWHQARLEEEERAKRRALDRPPSVGVDADNPVSQSTVPTAPSPSPTKEPEKGLTAKVVNVQDHPMSDARPVSPKNTSMNESSSMMSPTRHKSPDLRLQLPPVPAFESPTSAHPSMSTPVSAGTATVQSPFSMSGFPSPFAPPSVNGVAATPSPVKKKLSLSDYKSRMNKAAAARPPIATTLLRPSSSEDPKSATSTDGGGAASSPTAERDNEIGTKSATHT